MDAPNYYADVMRVADAMLDVDLECRAGNYGGTFERPREAVGKEDELQYSEPPPWMVPTRHALGRFPKNSRR